MPSLTVRQAREMHKSCYESSSPSVPLLSGPFAETALTSHPLQDLEEPIDILCRVVQVGRDAHALPAHADEDVVCREPGGEVLGGVRAEHQPDHVPRTLLLGDRRDTKRHSLLFDEIRQRADSFGDVLHSPVEDLAQRLARHGEQGEVAPLSHVVASGARLEGVLVRYQPRKVLASAAVDPVVLYGLPLPILLPNIHKPHTIRSEQPLVRRGDEKVGPDLRYVEGISPERLYRVDDKRRAHFADPLTDAPEVDERAVGPVTVRDGDNGGVGVDLREQGSAPVEI